MSKQRLDVFPYPRGAVGDHAQPHLVLRNQAGLFDLLERLAEFAFILHLMPTEQMHDAFAIHQIKAKALGVMPLTLPARSLRPMTSLPRATPASAVGTHRYIGPIHTQHSHRTPSAPRRHSGDALLDLLARRRHSSHRQALSHLVGARRHPLTAHAHAGQVAQ